MATVLGPQVGCKLSAGGPEADGPSPHPRGTYALPPVHCADAAQGVAITDAGLQASLRRDARR